MDAPSMKPKTKHHEHAPTEAQFLLEQLKQGRTVLLGSATMIVPYGVDIESEIDAIQSDKTLPTRKIKDPDMVAAFRHPEMVRSYLTETK